MADLDPDLWRRLSPILDIALEPLDAEALFNRGKLHLDAGEYRQAIDDLQIAVAAKPGLVRARINLGIARIDAGDRGALDAYPEFLVRGTTSPSDRDAVLKKVKSLDRKAGP